MKPTVEMPAGEFKAKCLHVMDEVNKKHVSVVITKHGKPVARLVPVEENIKTFFGCLENTLTIEGDIIAPIDDAWEADS